MEHCGACESCIVNPVCGATINLYSKQCMKVMKAFDKLGLNGAGEHISQQPNAEMKKVVSKIPVYLQTIIKKIDGDIEAARKSGSCYITGLLLARQIICQETSL